MAHRRDKGYCWGTLFWQHNDCWPVASWASRDWYGVWKAQHYFARKAFDDILVSTVCDDEGKVLSSSVKELTVPANYKVLAHRIACSGETSRCIVNSTFTCDRTYREITTFELLKNMKLPQAKLTTEVAACEGGYKVTVASDRFARAVWLTIDGVNHHFSDNYFDLLPGEKRTVSVKTELPLDEFRSQLRVRHIAQTISAQ